MADSSSTGSVSIVRNARAARFRRLRLHGLRFVLFVCVIGLVHWKAALTLSDKSGQVDPSPKIQQVRMLFPQAASTVPDGSGGWDVLDDRENVLGQVVTTSPQSDHIVGFSGPTNTLVGIESDETLRGIHVISSGDTRDHLEQVLEDDTFISSFRGLPADPAEWDATPVDGVSGATLTALAIRESVLFRLQDQAAPDVSPSLKFPDELTVEDAQLIFDSAAEIAADPYLGSRYEVFDADAARLGGLLRTSPFADNVIGYQGPTDAIIGFDVDGIVVRIGLLKSYDNNPYVDYVRDDRFFLKRFNDRRLDELASLDSDQLEIEGVSGATMTSMAVADGVFLAAAGHTRQQHRWSQRQAQLNRPWWKKVPLKPRDLGTLVVILAGLLIVFTSLRGSSWVRIVFQMVLILYLGLINGDLVSQAMIVGWAQNGIPTKAIGLVLLTLAAFVVPLTTRRNAYCTHLCPHGAVQQLIKNRLPWKLHLSRRSKYFLEMIPGLLLVWCVIVAMTSFGFSLVDIEPFDAWVFRIAGWATIAVAVVGLVAALFVPMAYCRYGCPTGALLNFLKYNSKSDRWSRRDWFATALVGLAAGLLFVP